MSVLALAEIERCLSFAFLHLLIFSFLSHYSSLMINLVAAFIKMLQVEMHYFGGLNFFCAGK
jgi:hypothetical protein